MLQILLTFHTTETCCEEELTFGRCSVSQKKLLLEQVLDSGKPCEVLYLLLLYCDRFPKTLPCFISGNLKSNEICEKYRISECDSAKNLIEIAKYYQDESFT